MRRLLSTHLRSARLLRAAACLMSALALASCEAISPGRDPERSGPGGPAGAGANPLPGGTDARERVASGKVYEFHGWLNLAQRQYVEAIRLDPTLPAGYESLLAHLGRISAWPAAWLVAHRARARGVAIDPAILRALDERSLWPISTGDPESAPPEVAEEIERVLPQLAGIPVSEAAARPDLQQRIRRSDEAMDRLIQLGTLVIPRLRRALAAERDDPCLRASLCNVLLRVELGRRTVGEAPDAAAMREIVPALLTLDRAELWFPLWNAATVLARLGDAEGLPVFDRVLAIDGSRLSGIFQSPRIDWDLLLVFAVGPLGERSWGVLEQALRPTAEATRRGNALRALAALYNDRLFATVREVAGEDWAPEFRLMIALYHLQFHHEDTLAELLKVLTHPMATEAQRMAAVQALGELGTSDAREAIEALAQDGATVVHRHAQQVLADLQAGRFAPTQPEEKPLTRQQLDQALEEMSGEYGVGLARLSGAFLASCGREDLPKLYELRSRMLWRVTSAALEDLRAVNEVIRRVLQRGR